MALGHWTGNGLVAMYGFSSVGIVEELIVTLGDKWRRAIYKSGVGHRTTGAHNRRAERGSGKRPQELCSAWCPSAAPGDATPGDLEPGRICRLMRPLGLCPRLDQ
jgi:hypothetical protein